MKFKGKLKNQTCENGKKKLTLACFGPNLVYKILSWVLTLLDVKHCVQFPEKLIHQTRKNGKNLVLIFFLRP